MKKSIYLIHIGIFILILSFVSFGSATTIGQLIKNDPQLDLNNISPKLFMIKDAHTIQELETAIMPFSQAYHEKMHDMSANYLFDFRDPFSISLYQKEMAEYVTRTTIRYEQPQKQDSTAPNFIIDAPNATVPIPEPSTLLLLSSSLISLFGIMRKKIICSVL